MNRFLVGSNAFFRGFFEDFVSKDVDTLVLEDNPVGYENVRQFHLKDRCIFQWRRMNKDEFIDLSLERGLGMELGKFLIPEVAKELKMDIDDLERLRPLAENLDEKHLYEKVIYDAYIENGCWVLTAEQREEAYRIYKECKEEKDENLKSHPFYFKSLAKNGLSFKLFITLFNSTHLFRKSLGFSSENHSFNSLYDL